MKKNSFYIYSRLYIASKYCENKLLCSRYAKEHDLKRISDVDIGSYKNSNRLFILGTGSSINNYSDQQWEHITQHDSIGLNYWLIHDFVPDIYVFEYPNEEDYQETLINLFDIKEEDYSDVPILLKDIPTMSHRLDPGDIPSSIKNNLIASIELPVPWDGQNPQSLRKSYKLMNDWGLFNQNTFSVGVQKRATLGYILSLAANLNYDQVVFCGVDLSNPEYFYTENSEMYQNKGLPLPKTSVDNTSHSTLNRTDNKPSIVDEIKALEESILNKKDVELYIGSKDSALYPELEYYFERDKGLH